LEYFNVAFNNLKSLFPLSSETTKNVKYAFIQSNRLSFAPPLFQNAEVVNLSMNAIVQVEWGFGINAHTLVCDTMTSRNKFCYVPFYFKKFVSLPDDGFVMFYSPNQTHRDCSILHHQISPGKLWIECQNPSVKHPCLVDNWRVWKQYSRKDECVMCGYKMNDEDVFIQT
jgi:hypothetical protein